MPGTSLGAHGPGRTRLAIPGWVAGLAALALGLAIAAPAGAQGALAKAKVGKVLVVGISGGNSPTSLISMPFTR